jgi:hypothetical protein
MKLRTRRAAVALGAAGALLVPVGVVAQAAVITPTTPRSGSLVQVGPIADNGYPNWYRDSNGIRLEGCWASGDSLCEPLADELPDPSKPASYPDNFPIEHFYNMADATVAAGVAGNVRVIMNVEGAWAVEEVRPGDQIVFGRIRIDADDAADGTYRITHPFGIDELTAAGGEGVRMTEDIGIAPGAFGGVMQSRVGPFLTWDTFNLNDTTPGGTGEPPAGYVGDPGVEHTIKGSPYGTNFVKIEQKLANGNWGLVGQTSLFTIQGRLAVNDGVDVQQATYRTMPDGTKVVEVFASSEVGEAIKMVAPDLGYRSITLEEDAYDVQTSSTSSHQEGRYYGRFAVKAGVTVTGGADATKIVIQNAGDVPVANKTVALSDVVTVTKAAYNGSQLTVEAHSSDPTASLKVTGYGALTSGVGTFGDVDAPPHVITVTSSEGGTATVPLSTSGPYTTPDLPVAVVTATPTRPITNQLVTLDASGSLDALSYEWEQVEAHEDTDSNPATPDQVFPKPQTVTLNRVGSKATFTPTRAGYYAFRLVAVGENGAKSPAQDIQFRVLAPTVQPLARAGAAQTVVRGKSVTLDGSLSIGAQTYTWEQIPNAEGQVIPADHVVTLSDPTAAKPTFTFPFMALPAAPGPNTTYSAVAATPLRFKLTINKGVTGAESVHETVVRPQAEALTINQARYRTRGEWRIDGTSDLRAGQRIAIVLGARTGATGLPTLASARGKVIGFANVDSAGAWSYVGTGPNPQDPNELVVSLVTAVSTTGAQAIQGITVTS